MGKKTKIEKCVYCGEEKETTRDHVISQNLFPKGYPKKNPVIVPSCQKCNGSFSLDEEYFRNFVCGLSLGHSPYANKLFDSNIARSIRRRPQIGYKAMSKMELVDLYTKSGRLIGKKTKIDISDDRNRHFNVLNKFIKGLFFHELEEILPNNYRIGHYPIDRREMLNQRKLIKKWNLDNKEIFGYGYKFTPNSYTSIWVTIFYGWVFFQSVVATDQDFECSDRKLNEREFVSQFFNFAM